MRRIRILALLALAVLAHSTAAAVGFPITPDPADCNADPIPVDTLLTRADVGVAATPQTSRPIDGPMDEELVATLTDTVVASVACANANQMLKALSYFTEDYLLHRISDEPAVTLGHLQAAATRAPDVAPVDERVTIEAVTGVGHANGRAELEVRWTNGGDPEVVQLIFVLTEDEWKVDDVLVPTVD